MNKEINIRIGLYPFKVVFVPYAEIDGCDGRTFHNDRIIKVRDDVDEIATALILRHEIVHAILGTQGRVYQKKFDLEDVCEFIAYKLPEINQIMETIADNKRYCYESNND